MTIVLREARVKVKRANKHIADTKLRLSRLPDSYVGAVEVNPATGNEVIKHEFNDPDLLSDIALMMGDTLHNLKCALDYCWLAAVKKHAATVIGDFAKFPVYPTLDQLER